uniref:PDZ domain-containing protein n=1 Tax=Wuchereria bancrofti TaxID=6293 RepID=A0A1I8EQG2_WUCBA
MGEGQNKWPRPWNHPGLSEIVFVDPCGAAANLAFVGDIILSVDDIEIHDSITLIEIMHKSTARASVKLRRNAYSHCRRIQSTIETLIVKRETKLLRAVNVYTVCVHARDLIPPDESDLLGLSVSYDARERLQVASAECWSLAAIHLRPGDTIKEVNRHPVASKSMLQYWILASMEKNGFVITFIRNLFYVSLPITSRLIKLSTQLLQAELLIHSNVDQNSVYDCEIEMPEDVVTIAGREIQMLRSVSSKQLQETKTILRKDLPLPKHKISVSICDKIIEFPIGSDYDPKKLCRGRKGYKKRLNRKALT